MPADATTSIPDGQTLRILLVEDSSTDQELVRRVFLDPAPLTGPIKLEIVGDADAALAAVRRATFEVILTDYSLPGRSGLELLQHLRAAENPTPVVILTGTGDEALAVTALQQGAADYVVKDLGFERGLPVVIERVLGKHALELELDRARKQGAQYTKRLERQVEEQTVSLRRALQESEALLRVGQALAAACELKPALDLVTQTTAQLVGAQGVAVIIRARTELVLASIWGAVKQAPGLKSPDLLGALAAGWQETAIAPLRDGEAELGVLWAGRSRARPFAAHELELLRALADMTALSIANLRAHEKLRRSAARERAPGGTAESATPTPTPEVVTTTRTHAPSSGPEPVDIRSLIVPPFPAALGRLLTLVERDDTTPEAAEEAVGLDPVLAIRAIQLAGAPALGRARPPSSLREALMVLGLRGVRNLAFAQFSRRLAVRWGLIDQLLWEQSLAAATGTQVLLEAREPIAADDAYLCGLLHNVGAVALNNAHADRYARAVERVIAEGRQILEVERDEFGHDSAAITVQLVSMWRLPPHVTATLKDWQQGGSEDNPVAVALRWACTSAFRTSPAWRKLLGERPEPGWIATELGAVETRLGLSAPALEQVRQVTTARCEALRGLVV